MADQQHSTGLASKYPYIPEHREALAKIAAGTDAKGIPTLAALAAQGELLRYDIVELQKALIAAGEHLHSLFPDEQEAERANLMEAITEALQSTGGSTLRIPWIAWGGELEALPGNPIEYEPIKFVLAVDSAGNALIADTQKPEGYDVFVGQWAEDNQIRNLPTEPGLYNCEAQPRWDSLDGYSDLGEMFFDITSTVKVARFDFGEAIRVFEFEQAIPTPMPQEMIDQLRALADEEEGN